MIRVEQTVFFDAGKLDERGRPQRGNCLACCVASIFEVPLERVDLPYGASWFDVDGWIRSRYPGVAALSYYLAGDADLFIAREDLIAPTPGYWIGVVESPRVIEDNGTRGTHAVVMHGIDVAWDPHPDRASGFGGFVSGIFFVLLNPARTFVPDPASTPGGRPE